MSSSFWLGVSTLSSCSKQSQHCSFVQIQFSGTAWSKSAFNSGAEWCVKVRQTHLSRASDQNRISLTTSSPKSS